MAATEALCDRIQKLEQCRAQPLSRDGATAAIEVVYERMTQMEERMSVTPPTPPPELLSTSSLGPQGVQDTEGPPDPVLSILKDLVSCMAAPESRGAASASARILANQKDLPPATSSLPTSPAQETASMAAQEVDKAHPSGPGWPTDLVR